MLPRTCHAGQVRQLCPLSDSFFATHHRATAGRDVQANHMVRGGQALAQQQARVSHAPCCAVQARAFNLAGGSAQKVCEFVAGWLGLKFGNIQKIEAHVDVLAKD